MSDSSATVTSLSAEPAFDSRAWLGVLRGGSLLSLARGTVLLLQAIQYVALAKFLAPSGFGQVGLFNIILLYASLTGFGTDNVAVRETPGRLAMHDTDRLEKIKNITFTYELILRGFLAALVATAAVAFYEGTLRTGMLLISGILVFDKVQSLYYNLGSALKQFRALSRGTVLSGFLMSALTLGLISAAGVYAQLIAMLATGIVMTLFYSRALALKPRLYLDRKTFVPILKMGLPFVGLSLMYYVWKASDRTLIAGMLTTELLGQYMFAVLSVQLVMSFLNDFQTAFQPAVYERTAVARSAETVFRIVRTPSIVLAYVTAVIIGAIWVCYRVVVLSIMPEYSGTIWVFRVLTTQVYFANIGMMAGYILRSPEVNRQGRLVWSYVIAAMISYALIIMSLQGEMGLTGVAAATLVAQLVAVVMTLVFAHKHYLSRWNVALLYYAELFMPFVGLALFFAGIYWIEEISGVADMKKTVYGTLLVVVFVGVLLALLERRVGVIAGLIGLRLRQQTS